MRKLVQMGLVSLLLILVAASVLAGDKAREEKKELGEKAMHDMFVPWPFRGAPDADGDGIPDEKDQCGETPLGALVDAKGCPLDADGDGVADGIDVCADTPRGAKVDAMGCSIDSDGDGIADGIDRCVGTPAGVMVDAYGCALDSDGDGIADHLDRCAETPQGAVVDGAGCPKDADSDGVPDGLDMCANTPSGVAVNERGCPAEVSAMTLELVDTGMIRSSSISFASGKADITQESIDELQEIGTTLVQWPEIRVEVGGHTDSAGSAEMNQTLSEQRATAVRAYLLQQYPDIESAQFTSKGYGETQPIADNGTAAGRAENRRVEFKVLNQEELKRGVKRRISDN